MEYYCQECSVVGTGPLVACGSRMSASEAVLSYGILHCRHRITLLLGKINLTFATRFLTLRIRLLFRGKVA